MRYIYSLLLLLIIFFSTNNIKSQTIYYNSVVMNSYNYNTWLQCETSGYGKGSFGIITYTTNIKTDNYYYYDIYLITNSYYKNGIICSSYIKNIKVYVWEEGRWKNVINFNYALVNPPDGIFNGYYQLSYIYNIVKVTKIKVTWDEVTTY